MAPLTEQQRKDVRLLQYLSSAFVAGDEDRSRVSSRQASQVLGLSVYEVEEIYARLERYGFLALGAANTDPGSPPLQPLQPRVPDARIDQSAWDRNRSPLSGLYAHYVASAPPSLRSRFSQLAVRPTRGCPPYVAPVPAACNTVVASDFAGVFNPNKISTFCCPQPEQPVELCAQLADSIDPALLATENLALMGDRRLAQLLLHAYGQNALSLAEWADRGPAVGSGNLFLFADSDETLAPLLAMPRLPLLFMAAGGPAAGMASPVPFDLTTLYPLVITIVPATQSSGQILVGGVPDSDYTNATKLSNGTWLVKTAPAAGVAAAARPRYLAL